MLRLLRRGQGSSPLARGGRPRWAWCGPRRGLIPAGAGRTLLRPLRELPQRAHPRWRGEDYVLGDGDGAAVGLIPAGAGRTCRCCACCAGGRAHPRWRGEDGPGGRGVGPGGGSSPLARGGRFCDLSENFRKGLIPAGAGRTTSSAMVTGPPLGSSPLARGGLRVGRAGQPRRRLIPAGAGRTLIAGDSHKFSAGSSPLARGGLRHISLQVGQQRLIPAGAGRTRRSSPPPRQATAHPRWRGEDVVPTFKGMSKEGSSPLARGGPGVPERQGAVGGLIPAGAGRTNPRPRAAPYPRAHPRWRGEDGGGLEQRGLRWGSSPLARGGLDVGDVGVHDAGLIPAGAGRTLAELQL